MDSLQTAPDRESEERARDRRGRALFEAIDDAVFVHDLEGRIVDANPAACRRLGYTRDELLRLTTRDIDDPEFATGFEERLQQQLAGGRLTIEGRHVTKDGRLIPVEINTSAIEIDGKPAVLAVMRDVSRRKAAERRQAAQYAVTQALAESTTLAEAAPRVLRAVGENLGWYVGALWSLDRTAQLFRCVDVWSRPGVGVDAVEEVTRRQAFGPGQGLPGLVWSRNEPVWVEAIDPADGWPRAAALLHHGLHAAAGFPVPVGGETIGVLEFFHRTLPEPDASTRSMMAAVGSQVGQFMERKRVEQALHESEAFYHSLVESLPQNIIRKDREGRFTFVNQRVCAILNRSFDEVVGKTDYDLFPRDLAEKYRRDDLQVVETRQNLQTVEAHQTPDGQTLYVQIIKTPVYDARGDVAGTQVIFWDVTERHRWEEALSESERRYRQLTEASQDAIIVTDQNGRITVFNPAAERTFGYAAAEVLGEPVSRLLPGQGPHPLDHPFEYYHQARKAGTVAGLIEQCGRRRDGTEFPLELSLSAIELGGERRFLGAIRDTTERNRMRTQLVQNEKLASIGLLSAGVAHEINNPLSYVSNNLVVLERDLKGLMALLDVYHGARADLARVNPAAAEEAGALAEEMDLGYVRDNFDRILTRTREGVQRVTRIVQSLRGLARTDLPRMEETQLPDLVDMSLEMVRGRLKRRGIKVDVDYGPTVVRCVPTQLSQVLLNLVVNALQAIESKGESAGGTIRIATDNVDDDVVIEVTDTGCGIDPGDLPKLFDPFFTTKPVGEGTGLGLSITHGIVTGHGGRIEVDSTPGEGSRFRIFLPQGSEDTTE
jgi:PAS domain S-box-containing protein